MYTLSSLRFSFRSDLGHAWQSLSVWASPQQSEIAPLKTVLKVDTNPVARSNHLHRGSPESAAAQYSKVNTTLHIVAFWAFDGRDYGVV
jgi:hypothetical protein